MQMEKAASRRRKALQLGTVVGVAAAAVLSSASPSWAAADAATLNPSSGPTAGGNSISLAVATQSDVANSFIPGTTLVTFESAGTCPTTHTSPGTIVATVAAANVNVLSPTRLVLTVPAAITTTAGISNANDYSVCAYNGAGTGLLAKAENAYHVGATPTITSWTPRAASSRGGGTIIITGTNLDNATASIGGVALTPSGSSTATTLIAPIPAHAAGGPYPLVVTKDQGGTASTPNAFTYSNGVLVSPNTGSNTKARTDISVSGANLSGIVFNATNGQKPDDATGHVYLTKGTYDPTKTGLVKANGAVTECLNVVPISDTELICSLYLAGGGIPMSSTRTVSATVSGTTLTAAAGAFGPGDVGQLVTGGTIGAGTMITSVTDPTRVVLSKAPTANITTATTLTLTPSRTFSNAAFTTVSGSTNLTSNDAVFASTDVGRPIAGTGIPAGTTIQSVSSATVAVLSQAHTASASGTYSIGVAALNEVPVGTYTVTVVNNGAVDAQNSNNYMRSVISSGSTFTVADY